MWEIILGVGIIFLILEMFIPTMFFINFALAAFICALMSAFTSNITILVIAFALLSLTLLYAIRPFFLKNKQTKEQKTGMESKYVGKIATAIEEIDSEKGVISIYDERWQARSKGEKIEKGQKVEITGYESLVMYVVKKD